MQSEKAWYVIHYYGRLMNAHERRAYKHLVVTAKLAKGRTDLAAQIEVKSRSKQPRGLLSDDPEVLRLATDGLDHFLVQTAQRILDEHESEVVFNRCPKCGALARTPRARQCRFCRFDWHSRESRPIDLSNLSHTHKIERDISYSMIAGSFG